MTVLNFPATDGQPTDGSFRYPNDGSSINGVIYTWNGTYWAANNAADLTDVFDPRYVEVAGDTMTGDLNLPNLEASGFTNVQGGSYSRTGDTDGNLFIGQKTDFTKVFTVNNGGNVVAAGDVQMASLNSGPVAGFRNALVNGDFRIWQRGTSGSLGASGYTADRWHRTEAGSYTRSSDSPAGLNFSIQITGGSTGHLYQAVELADKGNAGAFASGTTWTLSFYVKSASGTQTVYAMTDFADGVTGTNASSVYNGSSDTFTATTSWQRVTKTFTIAAAPNASNICFRVLLRCNSRTAGLHYAGVQLEPGPVATPLEMRSIGTELALCQRYFQKVGGAQMPIGTGFIAFPTIAAVHLSLKTEMRARPSVTSSGVISDFELYANGIKTTITSLPVMALIGTTDAQLQVDGSSYPPVGSNAMLRTTGAAGAVNFDAEL